MVPAMDSQDIAFFLGFQKFIGVQGVLLGHTEFI
jgi:hypothetical protein